MSRRCLVSAALPQGRGTAAAAASSFFSSRRSCAHGKRHAWWAKGGGGWREKGVDGGSGDSEELRTRRATCQLGVGSGAGDSGEPSCLSRRISGSKWAAAAGVMTRFALVASRVSGGGAAARWTEAAAKSSLVRRRVDRAGERRRHRVPLASTQEPLAFMNGPQPSRNLVPFLNGRPFRNLFKSSERPTEAVHEPLLI